MGNGSTREAFLQAQKFGDGARAAIYSQNPAHAGLLAWSAFSMARLVLEDPMHGQDPEVAGVLRPHAVKPQKVGDRVRRYVCHSCRVLTPVMTDSQAAFELRQGHDLTAVEL